uniref:AAA+ ATPase domain-containing protein n=1 Tax=Trypanosoma congolense (strain IL3000) TaxID=1068625 RepID=G0USJ2_TRYCI|nr:conserved hypothetical protein [Trypanosoma congolense IL3000]
MGVSISVLCVALLLAGLVNVVDLDWPSVSLQTGRDDGCGERPLCESQYNVAGGVACRLFLYPVNVGRHDYKEATLGRLRRMLQRNLKGQPHVVEGVKADVALKLENPAKPLVLHFAGDNGVGKTTLAQIISLALAFRCQDPACVVGDTSLVLSGVSYDGYSVAAFRKDVVQKIVEHTKRFPRNGVVIINDLNGLQPDLVRVLLPLLGRAEAFPEAPDTPLNYLTVIITTDFGRQGRTQGKSVADMRRIVENDFKSLYSHLSASMIQTYPFLPASLATAKEIVKLTIDNYRCDSQSAITKLDIGDDVVEWFVDMVKEDLPAENGRCVSKAVSSTVGPAVLKYFSRDFYDPVALHVELDDSGSVVVREEG